MTLVSILSLAFLIGMGHALETDHLAAVSNMLAGKGGRGALVARGASWGVGHTLALFTVSSTVVLLGLTLSGAVQAGLEFAVGVMILALGAQTLRRLWRDRIHVHLHEHDGARHMHAHSHRGVMAPHPRERHDHSHRRTNLKALGVGLMHGVAGSGALLALTVSATESLWQALLYFAVFGVGSVAGMAALSAIVSYPLMAAERGGTWMRAGTAIAIGAAAIWIGGVMVFENGMALGAIGG